MKTNVKTSNPVFTHEGGKARHDSPLNELKRTVGTCMLFENTFYERGSNIAKRIADLCRLVKPKDIYDLAVEARTNLKLRHVPLFLAIQYIKNSPRDAAARQLINQIVQRPDEMGEMISIYWKEGKRPLPAQMKKGLASCFGKFNAFNLAKWDSASDAVRIRDVMFMTHPKPVGSEQEALFRMVAQQTLPVPVTWETELSAGKDKKETWEMLLREKKLGVMAFLMNLRNMDKAGVDKNLISTSFASVDKKWALPFRFITSARHAPWFGKELSEGLLESIKSIEKLPGKTYVIVDTSGSMVSLLSNKGETLRIDAAAGLAAVIQGIVPQSRIFWFSDQWGEIGTQFSGLALADAIRRTGGGGTYLRGSTEAILKRHGIPQRVIIVTDEQSHDGGPALPNGVQGYIINTAPYQYGVEKRGGWIHINGFSERVIDWIRYEENAEWSKE